LIEQMCKNEQLVAVSSIILGMQVYLCIYCSTIGQFIYTVFSSMSLNEAASGSFNCISEVL